MKTFYTLSAAAGMIRSNKFLEKADAISIGSFRAEQRNMPITIWEHKNTPADKKCILVCNPDGSVGKPKGVGYKLVNADHHSMVPNSDHANTLIGSSVEKPEEDEDKIVETPMTALYLKSPIAESQVADIEHALDVPIGLYDNRMLHCYTEDAGKINAIETALAAASILIDRVSRHRIKAAEGTTIVESAARKAHARARAANLPELAGRASIRAGRTHRVQCHCELFEGTDKKPPVIAVYADGKKIGDAGDERGAKRLISEHSSKAFSKFLKKELA